MKKINPQDSGRKCRYKIKKAILNKNVITISIPYFNLNYLKYHENSSIYSLDIPNTG